MADSDHLLSIAGAVVDGAEVAWADEASRAASPSDVDTIAALQDLHTLWSAFRRLDAGYDAIVHGAGIDSVHRK